MIQILVSSFFSSIRELYTCAICTGRTSQNILGQDRHCLARQPWRAGWTFHAIGPRNPPQKYGHSLEWTGSYTILCSLQWYKVCPIFLECTQFFQMEWVKNPSIHPLLLERVLALDLLLLERPTASACRFFQMGFSWTLHWVCLKKLDLSEQPILMVSHGLSSFSITVAIRGDTTLSDTHTHTPVCLEIGRS